MRKVILLAIAIATLSTASAGAAGIDGRLGIFGKLGAFVPLKGDFVSGTTGSKTGFATGGGLVYGFGGCFAAELDVTHVPSLDVKNAGIQTYEASFTDLALGLQYRFIPDNRMVPYLGAGVDLIKGELEHSTTGTQFDLDWTVGGHLNAGLDYFITRGVALTTDLRVVYAAKGDVTISDAEVGRYNPTSFIGSVGIRLFLPQYPFN